MCEQEDILACMSHDHHAACERHLNASLSSIGLGLILFIAEPIDIHYMAASTSVMTFW